MPDSRAVGKPIAWTLNMVPTRLGSLGAGASLISVRAILLWGRIFLFLCIVATLAVRASSSVATIVLDPTPGRSQSDWRLEQHSGRAGIASCNQNDGSCIHFTSQNSSFALERSVEVNPADLPFLSWRWKVTRLPQAGDFRRRSTDDQAAQLLVAFTDRTVLSYLWDSNAPKGAAGHASAIPLIHVFAVVCESGPSEMNRWVNETRNVAADYERAFGRPAPRIKGLRLQINTQHTGADAESYFGQVAFRSTLE